MPIDVFDEIFWTLSRKTIARCRCVSKLWSSILGRSDFSDLFLKKYSACRHLLFAFKLNGKWLFFSSPQPQNLDENSSLLATNHHMCFRTRPGSCRINVPIRGLLCTTSMWLKDRYNDFKAMVYNPSTGQTITLPNLITSWNHARAQLGYDPINKQVKNLVADTRLKFVGMTSNGEIVFSPLGLSDPFYIFYYNMDKNTVVRVKIQGIGPVSGQDIYTFVDHVEDVKLIT
ncbi:PREDICTED: F-box protein DOR-like [Camelina sativa]|uniref:F-box protein DOR-like n=1 Tax=Camelina sativa TaxID=90675 RepID=A0ABM0USQ6_CAMSA|nr:PREDICTED: F-box protein DOR-like [Camelina sativa]